jgi:predicted ABC-type transport system involved in lysophospholipase L1 biosynthesis ATPase subunit
VLTPRLLELRGVTKAFGGLRPLRVADLSVNAGEAVILGGLDETAAAVLVDLVTGTALPDAGEVVVAGTPTSAIADHEGWLAFLEQFGIVNSRVVLLDGLTALQNVAVPLTLDLDPLPPDARSRAVAIASTVGIDPAVLDRPLGAVPPLARFRVRLARAIAHEPRLLLVEHPTFGLDRGEVAGCEAALAAVLSKTTLGALVISTDQRLHAGFAARRLSLDAGTGKVVERRSWPGWLHR